MMNSYRQNNVKRDRRRLLFASALVIIIFVIDGLTGGTIRTVVRAGALSVGNIGARTGEVIFGSGFFSTRRALEKKNQALREELSQFQMRAAAFDVLKEENKALRDLVHLAEDERGITAPVASSFRASPYGTFLIGAGTEDGVSKNNLVLVGDSQFDGFVIGRVEDAGTHTSLVRGIFAPGEKTEAVVGDIAVSVEGRGGGQARAEVPREASLGEGESVFAGAMGGRAIGVIGKVEKKAGDASQVAYIHFPINQNEVRFVYVLTAQQ